MYNHNTTVTVTMNPSSALLEALLFPHSVLPTQAKWLAVEIYENAASSWVARDGKLLLTGSTAGAASYVMSTLAPLTVYADALYKAHGLE